MLSIPAFSAPAMSVSSRSPTSSARGSVPGVAVLARRIAVRNRPAPGLPVTCRLDPPGGPGPRAATSWAVARCCPPRGSARSGPGWSPPRPLRPPRRSDASASSRQPYLGGHSPGAPLSTAVDLYRLDRHRHWASAQGRFDTPGPPTTKTWLPAGTRLASSCGTLLGAGDHLVVRPGCPVGADARHHDSGGRAALFVV